MGLGAVAAVAAVGVAATVATSTMASNAQTEASNKAIAAQQNESQAALAANASQEAQTRSDLMPYQTAGQAALPGLTAAANAPPPTLAPMDQATLEQTPGYQFNLAQGLKATQNSAAARGLGVSGAALKGAATYATGLADSTYQNQFNNAVTKFNSDVTNQTNTYNRLLGVSNLGESAAAQTGSLNTSLAANSANNMLATGQGVANSNIGAGNAQAAADMAIGNSVSSAANAYGNAYLVNGLLKGNGSSGLYGTTNGYGAAGPGGN